MHPEVKTDKPGKCPKCGMDLIEKKQSAYTKYLGNRNVEDHATTILRKTVNIE